MTTAPLIIDSAETWPEWGLLMVIFMSILIPVFLAVSLASEGGTRGLVLVTTFFCFVPVLVLGALLVAYGKRLDRRHRPSPPPPPGFA